MLRTGSKQKYDPATLNVDDSCNSKVNNQNTPKFPKPILQKQNRNI